MSRVMDLIGPECAPPMTGMECAVVGSTHMHIYFQNGERAGCRFWDDTTGSLVSNQDTMTDLWKAGQLWSEGPWRHTVTLQKFVDGILGTK